MSVSDAHTVKDDVRSWSSLSDSNDDGSSDGDGDDLKDQRRYHPACAANFPEATRDRDRLVVQWWLRGDLTLA